MNGQLFASASDERQVLRLYRRGVGGEPVASLDLSAFLGARPREEADFEGGARVGDLIFWIGSHGRKEDGRLEPGRRVLVATAVRGEGLGARLATKGRPFRGLIQAMAAEPSLAALDLGRAAGRPGEAPGGLNIEGLAAGPEGALWIAFRNPVPLGLALLVPLLNPGEAIEGRPARLGAPVRLDLGGLGIRDIARAGNRYLILAGSAEGGGRHRLYVWTGGPGAPVEVVKAIPKSMGAEAIVVEDAVGVALAELLDDDASRKIGGRRCDSLAIPGQRSFRALDVGF
ncbi:MAG: DUF3616 domain-containing protein [Planctomycetota bacterium]|nr:DUF3616 domain-containing protein [Planctomycetota bacterium]